MKKDIFQFILSQLLLTACALILPIQAQGEEIYYHIDRVNCHFKSPGKSRPYKLSIDIETTLRTTIENQYVFLPHQTNFESLLKKCSAEAAKIDAYKNLNMIPVYLSTVSENKNHSLPLTFKLTANLENSLLNEQIAATGSQHKNRNLLILFHGTCSNRNDHNNPHYFDGEIISKLNELAEQTPQMIEYFNYQVYDGPGSGNHHVFKLAYGFENYHSMRSGIAFGAGIQENIFSVAKGMLFETKNPNIKKHLASIKQSILANGLELLPKEIVVVGWSRGGASAYYLAHHLHELRNSRNHLERKIARIPIHIFAIDPVPGGLTTNSDPKTFTLPPQVKTAKVIVFEDERSYMFNAAIPMPKNIGTELVVDFLPGDHSMGVGNNKGYLFNNPISTINRHMVGEFLFKNGFPMAREWIQKEDALEELYKLLQTNRQSIKASAFKKTKFTSLGVGLEGGYISRQVYYGGHYTPLIKIPEYILFSDGSPTQQKWINNHHMNLVAAKKES